MFVGRENELGILENIYTQVPTAKLVNIFSPTKVGKTKLILEFAKNKNLIYIDCSQTIEIIFFKIITNIIISFFSLKNAPQIKTINDLFTFLKTQQYTKPVIIVFDNFHNLYHIDKDIVYNLNLSIKKHIKRLPIMVITSSRYYNHKLKDEYDKAHKNIYLAELGFDYIDKIFPNIKKQDRIYLFSAFGTNLEYLKFYDIKKDFMINIQDFILDSDSILFDEGINILKRDLNDIEIYASILYSIAIGNSKIGDIAEFLELKSTYLSRYIQKLLDYMYITKKTPVSSNKDHKSSKFGRYYINNNFLRFWLCYIYPNQSILHKKNIYPVVQFISKDFNNRIVKYRYKEYVGQLISNNPKKYLGYQPDAIGSWWNNHNQSIDIVAFDDKYITFVDCLWKTKQSTQTAYEILEKKASKYKTNLERKYIVFLSSVGLNENI
jgi:AAA+ ATPase superfamily predicted ATPase